MVGPEPSSPETYDGPAIRSTVLTEDQERFMVWSSRCGAVAGSASYIVNGCPALQVKVLIAELRAAAADKVDWRKIYECIYEFWHAQRPLFPNLETMAPLVEMDTSQP
jgi:hypothetical protein